MNEFQFSVMFQYIEKHAAWLQLCTTFMMGSLQWSSVACQSVGGGSLAGIQTALDEGLQLEQECLIMS